jgi:2-amino-4-hydroxy-6-hydroxymethyldihydropteridine diphosphokinase
MSLVYLGLGSNVGDRASAVDSAIKEIEKRKVGRLLRTSRKYETEPLECPEGGPFINQTVELMTGMAPRALLRPLKQIEADLGRPAQTGKNSPRTIDIDILLYDSMVIAEKDLTVPHPGIRERRFVLQTLADIKPGLFHPVAQKTVTEIMQDLPSGVRDQKVSLYEK